MVKHSPKIFLSEDKATHTSRKTCVNICFVIKPKKEFDLGKYASIVALTRVLQTEVSSKMDI